MTVVPFKPNRKTLEKEYDNSVKAFLNMGAAMELADIGAFLVKQRTGNDPSIAAGVLSAQKYMWDHLKQISKSISATRELLEMSDIGSSPVAQTDALLRESGLYTDAQVVAWKSHCNLENKEYIFDNIGEGKDIEFVITKLVTMPPSEVAANLPKKPKVEEEKPDDQSV